MKNILLKIIICFMFWIITFGFTYLIHGHITLEFVNDFALDWLVVIVIFDMIDRKFD